MSESNGLCGYIHDGYTRAGYIAAVPRLHPALRFTYRPVLSPDRAVIYDRIGKADAKTAETLGAQAVFIHLSDWDLKDGDGKLVPRTVENILRVQPKLETRLFDICMGNDGGDEDSEMTREGHTGAQEPDLIAELSVGAAEREAAEVKNLPPG